MKISNNKLIINDIKPSRALEKQASNLEKIAMELSRLMRTVDSGVSIDVDRAITQIRKGKGIIEMAAVKQIDSE